MSTRAEQSENSWLFRISSQMPWTRLGSMLSSDPKLPRSTWVIREPKTSSPSFPPISFKAHRFGGAVLLGHREGVMALLCGAVHLLEVPKLKRRQSNICRKPSAPLSIDPRPPIHHPNIQVQGAPPKNAPKVLWSLPSFPSLTA